MHYLAQLIGIQELASRGIIGSESLENLVGRLSALSAVPARSEAKVAEVRDGLRKLIGRLELRSEYQDDHITIDIDDIARDVVANHLYLLSSTMRCELVDPCTRAFQECPMARHRSLVGISTPFQERCSAWWNF